MTLIASSSLIVVSTLLLGFAAFCTWLAPPVAGAARGLFVFAFAGAGVMFALLAMRELRTLRAELRYTRRH